MGVERLKWGSQEKRQGADKAAGGGESDIELNTNKTRKNELEKEWEHWEGDDGENSPRKKRG